MTPRFTALASHHLVEPCFCRPGEGHDKGGVESRGKAVRQQVLVPIPVGPTLAAINAMVLAQMDAQLGTRRDASGRTIRERFTEEQAQFRLAPTSFAPEATTFTTVSPRALVRLEGAAYSVPSRWAGLDLVVRIGATIVTIVGRDGTRIVHPRMRFGQRSIDYCATSTWRAGVPLTTTTGSSEGPHERRHPCPRSRRRANAGLETAGRRAHL